MTQQNEKILEKLKKLLALAKSDNPHEAAVALQRAQKLMQAYHITQEDIELSNIDESLSDYWATGSIHPPRYMLGLLSPAVSILPVICWGCYPLYRRHLV